MIRNFLHATILLLLILASNSPIVLAAEEKGDFYTIPISTSSQIDLIKFADVAIRHRSPEGVVVRIEKDRAAMLEQLGFNLRRLDRDPALPSAKNNEDYFHVNREVGEILQQIAEDYPGIARYFSFGESVEHRPLHGLVISDNVDIAEDEAEIRVQGGIHGNELMAVEVPLNLALYLVENYESSERVRAIVDDKEITIIPCINPDGRIRQQRTNKNGVDLNRDFSYMFVPSNPDDPLPSAPTQPESIALAKHISERNAVLAYSYHTYGDIVNWLWNFTPQPSPDESLIEEFSDRYASFTGYTSINGFDWYQSLGDTNDFSYGCRGQIEWTIELDNDNIDTVWSINRLALLDAFEKMDRGVRGIVRDSKTFEPLHALIRCNPVWWPVYSDPDVGDYHRILENGNYSCNIWAQGYETGSVGEFYIGDDIPLIRRNIDLDENNRFFAFQTMNVIGSYLNTEFSPDALGPPDGNAFSMGMFGQIVLDMAMEMEFSESSAIKVYESYPFDHLQYSLYLSDDFLGPWQLVGQSDKTATFIPYDMGIEKARYVRIVDRGEASSGMFAGFDLDAVEYITETAIDGDFDEEYEDDEDGDLDNDETVENDTDLPDSDPIEQDLTEIELDINEIQDRDSEAEEEIRVDGDFDDEPELISEMEMGDESEFEDLSENEEPVESEKPIIIDSEGCNKPANQTNPASLLLIMLCMLVFRNYRNRPVA